MLIFFNGVSSSKAAVAHMVRTVCLRAKMFVKACSNLSKMIVLHSRLSLISLVVSLS